MKKVHNVTCHFITFLVVHVVGMVWAKLTKYHGPISRMVGGPSQPSQEKAQPQS